LYPNARLKSAGPEVAEYDIEDCLRLAKGDVPANEAGEAAAGTARRGAEGAATGAAVGAVVGNAGRGAAAGAAGGAARVTRWMFGPRPDGLTRRYVETCLRERGYQTIGWR
jgi:hypothetical protein